MRDAKIIAEHYLLAAVWLENNFDHEHYDPDAEWSEEAKAKAVKTAEAFLDVAIESDLETYHADGGTDPQIGHDLWLTADRHGSGFWDRGGDKEAGERLTEIAHSFGESDVWVANGVMHL